MAGIRLGIERVARNEPDGAGRDLHEQRRHRREGVRRHEVLGGDLDDGREAQRRHRRQQDTDHQRPQHDRRSMQHLGGRRHQLRSAASSRPPIESAKAARQRQARERGDEHDQTGDAQLLAHGIGPPVPRMELGRRSRAASRTSAAATPVRRRDARCSAIDGDDQRRDAEEAPRRRRCRRGAAAGARTSSSRSPAPGEWRAARAGCRVPATRARAGRSRTPRCRWCRCRRARLCGASTMRIASGPDPGHRQQRHGRTQPWRRGSMRPGGRRSAARPRRRCSRRRWRATKRPASTQPLMG